MAQPLFFENRFLVPLALLYVAALNTVFIMAAVLVGTGGSYMRGAYGTLVIQFFGFWARLLWLKKCYATDDQRTAWFQLSAIVVGVVVLHSVLTSVCGHFWAWYLWMFMATTSVPILFREAQRFREARNAAKAADAADEAAAAASRDAVVVGVEQADAQTTTTPQ
jgi:hypothetical protein